MNSQMHAQARFQIGFKTDIGRKRQQNQDNGGAFPELGLFVVADGMGGHRGGETASSMIVDILPQAIKDAKQTTSNPQEIINGAIRKANQSIFEIAQKQPELHGMGSTAIAAYFVENLLILGHVGDSRCYFIRPEGIWQLTRDHSLVQEKLRAGLITRDQVKTDKMKNVITRSVGFEEHVDVENYEMTVQSGDLFLLCSDGLSGLVDERVLFEIVNREVFEGGNAQEAVDQLIKEANHRGGEDNITALIVQVETPTEK